MEVYKMLVVISVLWACSVVAALQVRKGRKRFLQNTGWIIVSFGLFFGVLSLAVHAHLLKGA
jgi:CHASE2 domain-containing sensor protein